MRRRHQRRVALLSFFLAPRARAPKYRGTRHVTADGARELEGFTASFMSALQEVRRQNDLRPAGAARRRVFLLDVGANDGKWADTVMRQAHAALPTPDNANLPSTHVELVLVEPQQRFYAQNVRRAAKWNGTFLPVAA